MARIIYALTGIIVVSVVGTALAFFFAAHSTNLIIVGVITACAALIPLLFIKPEMGLVMLLIVRNSIDLFDQTTAIPVGPMTFNLAALLGLLILPWIFVVALREFAREKNGIIKSIQAIPLVWVWMPLLAIAFVSLVNSADVAESISHEIKLFDYFALFLLGVISARKISMKKMFAFISATLAIPVLFGLYQLATHTTLTNTDVAGRLHGTFVHPNAFGFALVIAFATAITLATVVKKNAKLMWMAATGILLVVLLFTQTRGAWVGAAIIGMVWLMTYYRKLIIPATAILLLFAVSFPVLAQYAQNNFNVNIEQSSVVQRAQLNDTPGSDNSFAWRVRTWKETMPAIYEQPLIGHGIGMYPNVRKRFISYETDLDALEAHNDYLRLAIEIGLIGLALYVLLFVRTLIIAIQNMTKDNPDRLYLAGYIALVIALMVVSVADNVLRNAPVQWMFWSLTGVVIGSTMQKKNSKT